MSKIKEYSKSFYDFFCKNKYVLSFWLILLFSAVIRAVYISSLPCGLNPDEASIGYDAWAIMHYGIDRNGVFLPVQLISWGSGQNALYAYLSMPFIALFGLNTLSVRMVNFIFGVLSIAAVYHIVKPFFGKTYALISMAFISISPWHIMICRWGLESNLFPLFFTAGAAVLVKSFENRRLLPLAAAIFALSLYSYGSAYVVVPVFVLAMAVYGYFKAGFKLINITFSAGVFVVIALPIGLCFLTNRFDWSDIRIFGLTAPQVGGIGERWNELTGFSVTHTARRFFEQIFLQTDYYVTNQIKGYGYMYLISLPFTAVGAYKLYKHKSHLSVLLLAWIACSVLLFFTYSDTNINRVNIIFMPIIIVTAIGLAEVFKNKRFAVLLTACYAVMFCSFAKYYFTEYNKVIAPFFYSSIEKAIPKAEELREEGQTVYMTDSLNKSYIYALFYSKTSPEVFIKTADIPNPDAQFYDCNSFEGYVFDTSSIESCSSGVYILPNGEAARYLETADEYYIYELYTVIKIK
ncbi:MAG: glycosyltransferase family 39 protein [Clostridia bacterium]|nr:glycosyltransferase family 39 protein [Clostridia bacterium]